MYNEDVIDLIHRVEVGTPVVAIPKKAIIRSPRTRKVRVRLWTGDAAPLGSSHDLKIMRENKEIETMSGRT